MSTNGTTRTPQQTNRSSALSTREQGSGHPKGPRPVPTMPFHWGKASSKRKRARQNGSTLAKTNERIADPSEVSPRFPSLDTKRRPLCPSVAMRDRLAVADTRSSWGVCVCGGGGGRGGGNRFVRSAMFENPTHSRV